MRGPSLSRQCLAEGIGTFVLVFFGIGSVHAAVLTGAQSGLWQVAVVWGVAISLAIYATGAVSGAHINPAMTLAFAAFRGFPARKVPAYVASQLAGAVLAAAVLFALFGNILGAFETARGITRGQPGSELSAMVYGEYFPNPAVARGMNWTDGSVSELQAGLAEGIGTAFLAMFVFAVTEARNRGGPGGRLLPLFIGLAVSIIISVLAPLTQAGLNPARDFGPRLFAYFAGWGPIAIPGPRGGFLTVYVLAPVLGALGGAGAYQLLIRPALPQDQRLELAASTYRRAGMQTVQLIVVGGFLGAGKTTLLWEAARRLTARGRRVGLITNDQAPDLVDTALLAGQRLEVEEVAGSCFCCNFPGLLAAAERLRARLPADVLIAEPVGSCTDLSATILQPLKERYSDAFNLSRLTVLADPVRLRRLLLGEADGLHPSAAYILRKQLEEADLIVVNKADLLGASDLAELDYLAQKHFPGTEVRTLSALSGQGVEEWLASVSSGGAAGGKIAQVDYDTYAEGEAVLGWLNAHVELSARRDQADWQRFCQELMGALADRFAQVRASVGHVKVLLSTSGGSCVGNLTRSGGAASLRGDVPASTGRADLTVNARVEMAPENLEAVVRDVLASVSGTGIDFQVKRLSSLRPGRPNPTYRYARVV